VLQNYLSYRFELIINEIKVKLSIPFNESLKTIEVQRLSFSADFDPSGFAESNRERRRAMNNTKLRVVLYEECGLGRMSVEMEEYFNWSRNTNDRERL
jgi:hypothetical protein